VETGECLTANRPDGMSSPFLTTDEKRVSRDLSASAVFNECIVLFSPVENFFTISCEGANCYSARSASITLTRAARAAGRSDATTATVISRNAEMATGKAPGIFISAK
jgi:hypothetical protein